MAQSLRPFPQFNTIIAAWAPNGNTWYDSLQAKATKRFSHGLAFTALFTWSKQLTTAAASLVNNATTVADGGAPGTTSSITSRTSTFRRSISRSSLRLAPMYTTPALKINKIASWVLRDWQMSGLLAYASGFPILAPVGAKQPEHGAASRQGAAAISYANRVPGVPLFTHDLNCHCFDPNKTFVLNPAAWTRRAGQWGLGRVL